MAKRVILSNAPSEDAGLLLKNGDLVIVRGTAYLVSSYMEMDSRKAHTYCALINIGTGAKAFKEPSSRSTTYQRLLNHFSGKYTDCLKLEEVKIVAKDMYSLEIHLHEGGCD